MEKKPVFSPEKEEKKASAWYILGAVGVLALIALLLGLFFSPAGGWKLGYAQPRITPTATPVGTILEQAVSLTPSPTPVEISVKREYPEGAVTLLVNGHGLFAMESREEAMALLEEYLQYWAEQPLNTGERLLKAALEGEIALGTPDGTEELLKKGEAYAVLVKNPGLLPAVRTTVTCRVETRSLDSIVTTTGALPRGTRFIRSLGSPEFTLVYSETTYKGAVAYSQAETNRFLVGSGGVGYVAEAGSAAAADPQAMAGEKDWPMGRKAENLKLQVPVKGNIQTCFGISQGIMHYGLTYGAKASAAVKAPESGVVLFAGKRGAMGYVVDIQHDENGFVSRVWGLGSVSVELFERVEKGHALGTAPDTGGKSAPITYELYIDSLPVNPVWYMR